MSRRISAAQAAFAALRICALALGFLLVSCVSGPDRQALAAEYLLLADGYAGLEDYEKALFFYERAAEDPALQNTAQYGMGRMYALSGNWDEAVWLFAGLYAQDPENEILLSSYAYALASSGNIDESLRLYRALRDSRPDDARLAADYVELLFAAGKYAEAEAEAESVRAEFPDSGEIATLEDLEERIAEALGTAESAPDAAAGNPAAPDAAGTEAESAVSGEPEE